MARVILVIAGVLVLATGAEAAQRINIILIVADDLGGSDLGCYGSRYHRTPQLDRLAAAGMRFTDAYSACPVCSPTRAALLTGRYPARLHLTDWLPGRPDRPDQKLLRPVIRQQLPLEEITLAEALQAAGYSTGQIGKWHLGGKGFGPRQQGFDFTVAGDEAGSPRSYFAPYRRGKDGPFIPGLEEASEGEYLTDRLTAEAEKFIDRNRDRPFFLYLAHYAVHIPLKAKPDRVAAYKPGPPGTQNNPIYAAMLESLDEGVGRIVRKLDELKLTERTAILFTSDNGGLAVVEGPNTPATINTPFREGKGALYEGGIRVPLVVRWPGLTRPGSTSAMPVSSIDVLPTVLSVCGVDMPAGVDGVSFAAVLRGKEAPPREALFWHYPHYCNQEGGKPGGAVRAGDWKLIEFYENGRRELYDLAHDVGETRNLIEDNSATAKELDRRLAKWRRAVDAQMPTPNPDFVANPQAADGSVTLHARTAEVHGTQLRYEPLPHKNTLGYWTRQQDWASWELTLRKPGTFAVTVLQGCGKGQGGSEVEIASGEQILRMTVEDTGGFQNFRARKIGTLTFDKSGRYELTVKARSKPGVAVMDLRSITLAPVPESKD